MLFAPRCHPANKLNIGELWTPLYVVLAARDVDAKPYRAATSSRPRLHHLRHADAVREHLTVALEKHYAVATGGNTQDVVAAEQAVYTFT
jgi:hypothetical protein